MLRIVEAQRPDTTVSTSNQFGTREALVIKEDYALGSPSESAIGVDFNSDSLVVGCGETAHHSVVGGGGHGKAFRAGSLRTTYPYRSGRPDDSCPAVLISF